MKSIRLDYTKACAAEPTKGHNRWHFGIPPALRVGTGEPFELDTRDALDGQIDADSTAATVATLRRTRSHPLTGPVFVEGAEPGDLLEIKIEAVRPATFGFTYLRPGGGFLPEEAHEAALARWDLREGSATSLEIPGVRIPAAPFLGVIGVAPSAALLQQAAAREARLSDELSPPPSATDAVPDGPPASTGLRTTPPREFGGNLDIRQLTAGSSLLLPVFVPGALLSVGDAHFAQGDGEVCGTAIEMRATARLSVVIHRGVARDRDIREPQLKVIAPDRPGRRYYATAGSSLVGDDSSGAADVGTAARGALRSMLDHLCREYRFARWQAMLLASVAVELRVSQVVNGPSFTVTAFLPLDIFE